MRLPARRLAALALPLAVLACAPAAGPGRTAGFDSDVITADEIAESGAENVLVLVSSRRPNWLRSRGSTSVYAEGRLMAYLDGTRLGGAEALREVTTDGIAMVRFYDAPSATMRFGAGHPHGAIQVISLVGAPPQ